MVTVLETLQNLRKEYVNKYYDMWKVWFSWKCDFYKPITPVTEDNRDVYQAGAVTSLTWEKKSTNDVLVVNATKERYKSKDKSGGMSVGYGDVFGLEDVQLLVKYDVEVDRGWKIVGVFMDREYVFYVQEVREDFSRVLKRLVVKP